MSDDFENRLRGVPWDTLYHSYGSAEDVPDMLLDLRSNRSRVRGDARNNLDWSLNHQGVQRWEATARAVPFLLEMLLDTTLRDRHLLLPLLADFATGSTDTYYLIHDFHIDRVCTPEGTREYGYFVFREDGKGSADDIAYGNMLRSIYDAVKKGIPQYLDMLKERRKPVRMYAAHLLGWLTDAANDIVPALLARLRIEYDDRVRASLVLALSYVTTFDEKWRAEVLPVIDAAWNKPSNDRFERRAVLIARMRCGNVPDTLKEPLLDMLRHPPEQRVYRDEFPWSTIDEMDTLLALAFRYVPDWKDDLTRAVADGLKYIQNEHDALSVSQSLIYKNFPELPEALQPKWYDAYRPVALEDLSLLQIDLLKALAECDLTWHFANMQGTLNEYGLPPYRDRLQRFLAGEGDVMRYRYTTEHVMPPEFFERVKAVKWRELRGAFGDTADIPDMLRALCTPDAAQRASARRKLRASLRRGHEMTAAAPVLPFLFELIENPNVPERHLLLLLVVDIVTGSAAGHRDWGYESEYYYLREGFNIDVNYAPTGTTEEGFRAFHQSPGSSEDVEYSGRMRALYDLMRDKLPLYLKLLKDDDARLRAYSAFVTGWLTTIPAQVTEPLTTQLLHETDDKMRASIVLALLYVTLFDPVQQKACGDTFARAFENAATPLEKRATALALLRSGGADKAVKAALKDALLNRQTPPLTAHEFPWSRLDDDRVLLDIVLRCAPKDWRADFADIGCTLLKRMDEAWHARPPVDENVDDNDDDVERITAGDVVITSKRTPDAEPVDIYQTEFASKAAKPDEELGNTLLARFFPELPPNDRMTLASKPGAKKPRKLSAVQRRIMQTIVDADMLWNDDGYPHLALLGYGFNGYRKEVRAAIEMNSKNSKGSKR